MTFSEQLVASILAYKKATGISTNEFARRAGISEGMLRRIKFHRVFDKGYPSITLRTAKRLEDAMQQFPPNGDDNGSEVG